MRGWLAGILSNLKALSSATCTKIILATFTTSLFTVVITFVKSAKKSFLSVLTIFATCKPVTLL